MKPLIDTWKCNTTYKELTSVVFGNSSYYLKDPSKTFHEFSISNLIPLKVINKTNGYVIRNNSKIINRLISEYTEASVTPDVNNCWTRLR